jgi:predicted deacetylase
MLKGCAPVAVHVSIHDVSPAWSHEVEAALKMCAAVGARPALLVVPNFHGRSALLEHEPLCERLRELQSRGSEVYLHGFFHQSKDRDAGPGRRGFARLFAQRIVSSGEAEMSDVTLDEGRKRLDEGEQVLQKAGLRIDGFVAPAWSMPRWLLPELAERGYRFAEDHLRVYDPAGKRARASVVLNWASRSPARLLSAVAWCRTAKVARAVIPARIAIHPADMNFLMLRREIARTLAWARGDFVDRASQLFS